MQIVPLLAIPSQTFNVVLGGQNCVISVYQRSTGLYLDLTVNNVPTLNAQICRDRTLLVRLTYLGFAGDLIFMDTAGTSDPVYSGLGTRFKLLYLVNGQ